MQAIPARIISAVRDLHRINHLGSDLVPSEHVSNRVEQHTERIMASAAARNSSAQETEGWGRQWLYNEVRRDTSTYLRILFCTPKNPYQIPYGAHGVDANSEGRTYIADLPSPGRYESPARSHTGQWP